MLNKGYYFTTFDLIPSYQYIEVHPEHYKFLGFEWTFEDGYSRYFQFCVLPFSLASACYIEDGIAAFRGFEIAKSVSEIVTNDLLSVGVCDEQRKGRLQS